MMEDYEVSAGALVNAAILLAGRRNLEATAYGISLALPSRNMSERDFTKHYPLTMQAIRATLPAGRAYQMVRSFHSANIHRIRPTIDFLVARDTYNSWFVFERGGWTAAAFTLTPPKERR